MVTARPRRDGHGHGDGHGHARRSRRTERRGTITDNEGDGGRPTAHETWAASRDTCSVFRAPCSVEVNRLSVPRHRVRSSVTVAVTVTVATCKDGNNVPTSPTSDGRRRGFSMKTRSPLEDELWVDARVEQVHAPV
jgi:hypothetical protein